MGGGGAQEVPRRPVDLQASGGVWHLAIVNGEPPDGDTRQACVSDGDTRQAPRRPSWVMLQGSQINTALETWPYLLEKPPRLPQTTRSNKSANHPVIRTTKSKLYSNPLLDFPSAALVCGREGMTQRVLLGSVLQHRQSSIHIRGPRGARLI